MESKARLSVLLLVANLTLALSAAPVSLDDARVAALAWTARGGTLGAPVCFGADAGRVHCTDAGNRFYSFRTTGGSTVFLAADDAAGPVLAFTDDDADYSTLDRSGPFWAMLAASVDTPPVSPPALTTSSAAAPTARTRWQSLLAEGRELERRPPLTTSATSVSSVGDLRVPKIMSAHWDQGKGVFNYYTPSNYVCGCVATAMAQVIRTLRFPVNPIAKVERTCKVAGVSTVLSTMGGTYDWDNMPDTAGECKTVEQKQAIGKLCYDAAVSVRMSFNSGGSGAYDTRIPGAMTGVFGYANICYTTGGSSTFKTNYLRLARQVLLPNFDAGLPVITSLASHEIVADGYGFNDGEEYVHFNYGWSGSGNGWFCLREMSICGLFWNLFTDVLPGAEDGKHQAVMSGRVTAGGTPVGGVAVSAYTTSGRLAGSAVSNARGIWSLILPANSDGIGYELRFMPDSRYQKGRIASVLLKRSSGGFSSVVGNSWGNDFSLQANPHPAAANPGATFEWHVPGDSAAIDEDDFGGNPDVSGFGRFWWGPNASSIVRAGNYGVFYGLVYRGVYSTLDLSFQSLPDVASFTPASIGRRGFVTDARVLLLGHDELQPALPDEELKLGVYAHLNADGTANLFVIAGDGVNDLSTRYLDTGLVLSAEEQLLMHRLTMLAEVDGGVVWFRVWLDERQVPGRFPSRRQGVEEAWEVRAFGFNGNGVWVDDVFLDCGRLPFMTPAMMFLLR